ncbi:PREDICTED: cuticle protein 8-like [Nicrophorus vespilloides]|uniref:Cuticle protein 8-like n=1 Tax=Nicrophorus vespilloides TaxID=110193 RepID=A0ABM1M2B7_NICVS|nr:PREDICTED: cuticle protein 8-like [Nicrophorus vespilloides]
MFSQILILGAVVAFVAAIPTEHASSYASVERHDTPIIADHEHHHHDDHEEHYPDAHPKYVFKYGVKDDHTGDHKTQEEIRDGDKVKGEYTVVQPDGIIRKVEYFADHHNGFNAQVSYSGHSEHHPVAETQEYHH